MVSKFYQGRSITGSLLFMKRIRQDLYTPSPPKKKIVLFLFVIVVCFPLLPLSTKLIYTYINAGIEHVITSDWKSPNCNTTVSWGEPHSVAVRWHEKA